MSETDNTPTPEPDPVEAVMRNWLQREAETRAHGVTGLKEAIPFLTQLGITSITLSYDGSGDSGDIHNFDIAGAQTAPKTETKLDEALKRFPEETNAYKRFNCEALKECAFEVLPAGFEINEGSYGEIVIDCVNDKVRIEHNERIMETNYTEQEW